MADPTPIRPGVHVRTERALQLVEHVADVLTSFPVAHEGENPVHIVVFVRGDRGTSQVSWSIEEDDVNPTLALAGALISHEAVT